jgi:hypothetical protein
MSDQLPGEGLPEAEALPNENEQGEITPSDSPGKPSPRATFRGAGASSSIDSASDDTSPAPRRSKKRAITSLEAADLHGYRGKPGPKPDFSWHETFLEALSRLGNVSAATRAAGVSKDTVFEHRKKYASFARRWTQSLETSVELLEQEAWRRATVGTEVVRTMERVNPDGSRVSETVTERKVSDALLIFLLKANKPERYRERYDVTGGLHGHGEPLTIRLAFDPAAPVLTAPPVLELDKAQDVYTEGVTVSE